MRRIVGAPGCDVKPDLSWISGLASPRCLEGWDRQHSGAHVFMTGSAPFLVSARDLWPLATRRSSRHGSGAGGGSLSLCRSFQSCAPSVCAPGYAV